MNKMNRERQIDIILWFLSTEGIKQFSYFTVSCGMSPVDAAEVILNHPDKDRYVF